MLQASAGLYSWMVRSIYTGHLIYREIENLHSLVSHNIVHKNNWYIQALTRQDTGSTMYQIAHDRIQHY